MKHRKKFFKEEDAANVVGNGKVAGLGVGPQGEPPVKKRSRAMTIIKRVFKAR